MQCLTDNIKVSKKTKICGVIGDPIAHSLSPIIQNAAFKERGLKYVYYAFQVKEDCLDKAISDMRELAIAGLNVTIPHKVKVMKLLHRLDPLAEKIGAVNTIVNREGILTGYNTDAEGFITPLEKRDIEIRGKKAIILGAGGAARAVAFALIEKGAELIVLNRTVERAGCLAVRIKEKTGKDVCSKELNPANLKTALAKADILVNTTSVGMSPDVNETPVPSALLRKDLIVYDIVYNPMQTKLIREARDKGAVTIPGLEMLAYQGAAAFELFTGVKAPAQIMIEELTKALKSRGSAESQRSEE